MGHHPRGPSNSKNVYFVLALCCCGLASFGWFQRQKSDQRLAAIVVSTTKTRGGKPSADERQFSPLWWNQTLSSSQDFFMDIVPSNTSKGILDCGRHKCFVPSQSHLGEYGYMIAPSGSKGASCGVVPRTIARWQQVWNMTQGIKHSNNHDTSCFRHFLASPPRVLCLNEEQDEKILHFLTQQAASQPLKGNGFVRASSLYIQVVRQAPIDAVLFQMMPPSTTKFPLELEKSLDQWSEAASIHHPSDDARIAKLQETFRQEMSCLSDLLRPSNETGTASPSFQDLAYDLQFFLDPEGRIWHLDLDRIFEADKYKSLIPLNRQRLAEMEEAVLLALLSSS